MGGTGEQSQRDGSLDLQEFLDDFVASMERWGAEAPVEPSTHERRR
jgi:hypothetical protein